MIDFNAKQDTPLDVFSLQMYQSPSGMSYDLKVKLSGLLHRYRYWARPWEMIADFLKGSPNVKNVGF